MTGPLNQKIIILFNEEKVENSDNKDCNESIIYIVKQDIRIYMLPIAGQTAGPIGLKFFVDTQGWPRSVI